LLGRRKSRSPLVLLHTTGWERDGGSLQLFICHRLMAWLQRLLIAFDAGRLQAGKTINR